MQVTIYDHKTDQSSTETITDIDSLLLVVKNLFGYNNPDLYLNNKLIYSLDQIKNNDIICVNSKSDEKESPIYEHIYIEGILDNYRVKMIVDSGAQKSIMSYELAKQIRVDNIIDKRYKGYATGMGKAAIIGRIMGCNIKIAPGFFISIDIDVATLDNPSIFLLGLDFLYPNKCVMDFNKQCILSGNNKIPFLKSYEIEELKLPINIVQESILSSYDNLKSNISYSDPKMQIISKIITNIINNPTQDKYKKINIQSKHFKDIYNDSNCMKFIQCIGFIPQGNTHMIFRGNLTDNLLVEANKILTQ